MEAVRVLDAAFELAARLGELMDEALDAQGLTPARAELVLALHQHGGLSPAEWWALRTESSVLTGRW
jgi:hypothetical protein